MVEHVETRLPRVEVTTIDLQLSYRIKEGQREVQKEEEEEDVKRIYKMAVEGDNI